MSHRQSQDADIILSISSRGPSPRAPDSIERVHMEMFNNTAEQLPAAASKPGGCAKRGGRPVTWIGGGGLDPRKLAGLGVPMLRTLFNQVFGEPTASNNASWLRRKLSESPDVVHGQRRSAVVRARDMGAAIWNSPLPIVTAAGGGDDELEGPEAEAGVMRQDCRGCDDNTADDEVAGSALLLQYGSADGCPQGGGRRSLKRSAGSAESADTLGYRGNGNNMHYPPSPSGSGSGSPTATHAGSGDVSPRGQSHRMSKPHTVRSPHHHKYHSKGSSSGRHCTQYQALQQQQLVNSGVSGGCEGGGIIRPELLTDSYQGLRVNVYWPQDHKWWGATICKLDTAACELQLLYSDMTEEAIRGPDFTDLLSKGHLALAAGVAPPYVGMMLQGYGKQLQGQEAQDPHPIAAATAAAGPATVDLLSGLPQKTDTSWLDSSGASIAAGVRSQSCLLPITLCDSTTSPSELTRSASASFAAKSSGAATGSNSCAVSASFGDFEGLAVKRQCCEVSGNTATRSDGATNRSESFAGFAPAVFTASTDQQGQGQQQQGPDTANLGAWFHAQQQQQLQLQLQQSMLQQSMQKQQQIHMAAQLSMQQAAAHFNQMSAPVSAAPRATAADDVPVGLHAAVSAAVACRFPAASDCPTPVQSPVASCPMPTQMPGSSSPVAVGRSNTALANDIEQLKQLQQRLRLAVGSPSESVMPGWPSSVASPRVQASATAALAVTPAEQSIVQQNSWPNQSFGHKQQGKVQFCDQFGPASTAIGGNCPPGAAAAAAAAAAGCVPQVPIPRSYSTPLTSGCFSSSNGPSVWMGMAPVLCKSVSCDAAVVRDFGAIKAEPLAPKPPASPPPPAVARTFSGTLQVAEVADCDDIDSLLAKPGDMFDLAGLGMEQSSVLGAEMADMDGMDMGDGSLGGGDPHSSCGGSLCESLADELVVAGLQVDAAPAYFMFGGGSPALQRSGGEANQSFAVAAAAATSADMGVLVPVQAESGFAHMFDD